MEFYFNYCFNNLYNFKYTIMRTTFKYFVAKRRDLTVEPNKKTGEYPITEFLVKYNAEIPSTHKMLR